MYRFSPDRNRLAAVSDAGGYRAELGDVGLTLQSQNGHRSGLTKRDDSSRELGEDCF
jgi:hypothetical protein